MTFCTTVLDDDKWSLVFTFNLFLPKIYRVELYASYVKVTYKIKSIGLLVYVKKLIQKLLKRKKNQIYCKRF